MQLALVFNADRIFPSVKLATIASTEVEVLKTQKDAFKRSRAELPAVGFIAGIVLLLAAMALYNTKYESQPEVDSGILASLSWAVVSGGAQDRLLEQLTNLRAVLDGRRSPCTTAPKTGLQRSAGMVFRKLL